MTDEKKIDESWKDSVTEDKDVLKNVEASGNGAESAQSDDSCGCSSTDQESTEKTDSMEVNFLNYVMSLGFQAMIFLGEVPNPVTNETDKNINQAKFLIDTLIMIKDKTKGNLDEQEENFLAATVYDLQTKYIESQKPANS